MAPMALKILGMILLCARESLQQKDPVKDFCRRFGHQTCVIDQRLYIDGGLVNMNTLQQNPNNYSNTWLSYHDLTTSPPRIDMPQIHANLSKNASIPDVSGGVLWPDSVNKRFYLYGGDYFNIPPNPPNLLSYDVLYDQWVSFGSPTDRSIQSVSWGAGVGVSSIGKGFVLGGWLSNNSVPGWTGPPLATSGLIQYDMDSNILSNTTGIDSTPRAEGVMVYIPASDVGMLVHFGGVTVGSNGTTSASPMSSIHLYDIKSSKWYTQTATGNIPPNRRRFCADAAWAPDRSSYNIYLYGGLGFGADSAGFDDMWILSLPSFTWINYYSAPTGTGYPHHSLSCNVVNNGQMLVIGGTFPLSSDCDSPGTWGVHNADLGKVSGSAWNVYMPNITTYQVPPEVISVVGGSSMGGAALKKPATGFQNAELDVYFAQHANVANRTPTRAVSDPSGNSTTSGSSIRLPGSAIAGISVGGAIFLGSIIIGGCYFFRRRRNQKHPPPSPPPPPPISKSPPYDPKAAPKSQSYTSYNVPKTHYQLPTTPEPAELYGSHYRMPPPEPQNGFVAETRDHDPRYHSPVTSPNPSTFSGRTALTRSGSKPETYYGSPTSPKAISPVMGRISQTPRLESKQPEPGKQFWIAHQAHREIRNTNISLQVSGLLDAYTVSLAKLGRSPDRLGSLSHDMKAWEAGVRDEEDIFALSEAAAAEVIVAGKDSIQQVLVEQDLRKAPLYESHRPPTGADNLISIVDKTRYKQKRRLLAPGFSISFLNSLEPLYLGCIGAFVDVLDAKCAEGHGSAVIDMYMMLGNLTTVFPSIPRRVELTEMVDDILAKRMAHKGPPKKDPLQIFLDAHKSNPDLYSEMNVLEEMCLFLIAGSDTGGATATFTLLLLLNNQEKLKLLVEEIDEAFPSKDELITIAKTQDLPYLNAVINDSMRVMPIATGLPRYTTETTVICDSEIPPRWRHFCNDKDPRIWPDPESVVPERWLGEYKGAEVDRKAFVPFSAGSRNCPGQQFALKELRLFFATLIHSY
ncbi:uncharacterized protein BP5553_05400 [Venustampulla echinocandica]|uniref:Cytochrome P450 n=1 Tax=Venustampulla echinocandica TaxID=2656787 RepID=A0A370TR23_9HELO|nr:uncharacterized protein BP5553_05400 [Venustampulla echinocandica]RDL37967.1 hypothetical protein BP5553_05400 [Venustampulla echinocandica]